MLWSTGEGRGAAAGDESVQRAQGLDGSPEVSSGLPAEEVSEPVLVGGLGRTGFHVEKITGRLSPTFLWIRKGNIVLPFGNYFFSWRRKWQPTPVSLPGASHGQRSLAGHGP